MITKGKLIVTCEVCIIFGLTIFIVTHLSPYVPQERIKYISSVYLFGKQNVRIIDENVISTGNESGTGKPGKPGNENTGDTKVVRLDNLDKKDVKTIIKTEAPSKSSIKATETLAGPTLPPCQGEGRKLAGPLFLDQRIPEEKEEKELSVQYGGSVEKGGWWTPTNCSPRRKVALIIPYRNREKQLRIFLRHMHPILQRQQLFYRIIVVEQLENTPFNRAGLFNVGYAEAIKMSPFDCFVFSDVDLLPEDDRNYYGCPTSPRHMSVAVDKFHYKLPYGSIFGGVGSFTKEDFEKINGMSNLFWGWGGEDDDLYKRITKKGYKLTRPSMKVGRYTMIKLHHFRSTKANPNRMNLLRDSKSRMETDGLNALKYHLKEVVEEPLVTFVKIEMNPKDYCKALGKC